MLIAFRKKYDERCPEAMRYYNWLERAKDMERCSGEIICDTCGHKLYDHPPHPFEEYLTVTCEGRLVKL